MPDGPWGDFGAAWLGWDSRYGTEAALIAPQHAALTERPRKYGFHATVRSPFRLGEGATSGKVAEAIAGVSAQMRPIPLNSLQMSRIGPFFALTAPEERSALQTLADRTVEAVDRFRAPLTPTELARRRAGTLSDRQEDLLARWGYPYVKEQYRFHLTLTGPVRNRDEIEPELRDMLAGPMSAPMVVDSLCLLGEAEDGRFHQIERFAF